MLPLVLIPGPGSVLYRGLGTVLVGGMALNAVFTLVLLPTLLRLMESLRSRRSRRPERTHEALLTLGRPGAPRDVLPW